MKTNRFPRIELPAPHSREIYENYKKQAAIALKMQTRGIRIDQDAVRRHVAAITDRKGRFLSLFANITGIHQDYVGIDGGTGAVKKWFKDKTGSDSVSTKEVLLPLLESPDDTIRDAAAALIGLRKAAKALTMLDAYTTYEVYPSWNVTGTKGARWSCSDPNIMQLPSHDVKYEFATGIELVAQNLKNIIVPRDGYVFVGADWSALELYEQTYLAKAAKLLNWIAAGEDLHMKNARIFFGDALPANATKKTHKSHREVGKLAFGFSYNVSDHVATAWNQMRAKIPSITMEWVQEARKRYFTEHPEFLAWQKATMAQIDRHGFVEIGLLKRRLYLESSARGYNQAMNAQCQTLGGDIMISVILTLQDLLRNNEFLTLTWYDSIITEVPNDKSCIEDMGARLKSLMSGPFDIKGIAGTFVAEPDFGPNLKDMVAL